MLRGLVATAQDVGRRLIDAGIKWALSTVRGVVDLRESAVDDDGNADLILAARDGYLEGVKSLVGGGADVDAVENNGKTTLMIAVANGHLDVVKYFVDHGSDLNVTDNNGHTALMMAAERGNLEAVKYLIDHGADWKAAEYNGRTAWMLAAASGHLEVVKYFHECGADVNATEKNEQSAWMVAASNGYLDVVEYLIDHGANIYATEMYRQTALIIAAANGQLPVVKYLVGRGVDVDATEINGQTALMLAAAKGRLTVVKFFVDLRVNLNTANFDGWTALILAARHGHLDVVALLVDYGAEVDFTDNNGQTALMRAAANDHLPVVRYLVEHGADVKATDDDGDTALVIAAHYGELEVVKYLVSRDKNMSANDVNDTQRALIRAVENDRLEVVKLIIKFGADVNIADSHGQTALMIAAEYGNLEVVKYLLDHKADIKAVNRNGLKAVTVAAQHGHREVHRMLSRRASESAMALTDTISSSIVASSLSPSSLLVSPFDITVKRATDSDNSASDFIATWLDADVAVKLFVPDASNTTFYDEVTLWHQLRHPNIIKLYGACDIGHNLFVCELATNGSVVDYLKSSSPANRRPWKYLHHAALGLAYLHDRGIIHGDLRGNNILLGDDDQAKLANFGLSGSSNPKSGHETRGASRGFVGSMRWQSPEMLEGGKPTYASDVYALGVCVVEFITGEIPWQRFHEMTVRRAKMVWEPEDKYPPGQPAKVSLEHRGLIKQLCYRDPTLRLTASGCVHLFEELAKQEEDNNDDERIQPRTPQQVVSDGQYWKDELAKLWVKFQDVCNRGNATKRSGVYRSVIEDLQQLYAVFQETPQPQHLVEQMHSLLNDAVNLVQNVSQTALVIQLSSTKATGSSVHALHRRIAAVKTQLGIHQEQYQSPHSTTGDGAPHLAHETQMFISEISKTWLILDDLKTGEERATFLAYLHSEINEHGASYSIGQLEIMQQAYADLKNRLDANEDFSTNLPVWFVPWYELSQGRQIEIGSGGFGNVYLTKWLDTNVVVKQLEPSHSVDGKQTSVWTTADSSQPSTRVRPHKALGDDERRIFKREVNIWFHLSHPHVVRLFGACHVGPQPFFVCEYASKGSLDKYLLKYPDEIWKKLHEAALGLLYLHERRIVHCDLKCNNIVVGSDKKAKVTDFGLSLAASIDDDDIKDKNGKNITGAWNWLAPELMLGHTDTPTRESDVFSFGMCIIEALRVVEAAHDKLNVREKMPPRVPWNGIEDKNVVKALMKRGQLPFRPIGCTDVQWELVERMCKFNPRERIQICTVVDELSALAGMHESEKPSSKQPTSVSSQTDISSLAESVRNHITHERSILPDSGKAHDKIYQIHELLWTRVEDFHKRIDVRVDVLDQFAVFAGDAHSASMAISSRSDSLMDFTEQSLQIYGLHRRLDKLISAAFVRVDDIETSAHNWKLKCYDVLGVDSSVAAPLLYAGGQSTHQIKVVECELLPAEPA